MVGWQRLVFVAVAAVLLATTRVGSSGLIRVITVDFLHFFPNGSSIPVNLNGFYGQQFATGVTPLSNEFAPLGIVFTDPLPHLLQPSSNCGQLCGNPPARGIVVAQSPGFFGDVNIRFLLPVNSVTVEMIGSGLNIAARLHGFNPDGLLVATTTHTYTGPTGQPSAFTLTAPPGEMFTKLTFNGGVNPAAAASITRVSFTVSDTPKANSPRDGLIWDDQFNGATSRADAVQAIAAMGDRVFAAGLIRNTSPSVSFPDFAVRAYDAWNGALLWQDVIGTGASFSSARQITADDGRVFVGGILGTKGGVRAYDAITGAVLWSDITSNRFNSTVFVWGVVAAARHVYTVGSRNEDSGGGPHTVRVYEAETGVLRWEARLSDRVTAIAVNGDRVFVAGAVIAAYDANTGAPLWQAATAANYVPTTIATDGRRVFTAGQIEILGQVPQLDFTVRAYGADAGELLWEDRVYGVLGDSGRARDVVADGRHVYVVGDLKLHAGPGIGGEFAVRAYDAETGRVVWMDVVGSPGKSESALAVTLRAGELMVAGHLDVLGTDTDFVVRTYDAVTGTLLWDDFVNGTANDRDTAIDVAVLPHAVYVGGTLRNVAALEDFTVRAYYR